MSKSIRITCKSSLAIPYNELCGIQGKLKEMSKENFVKLRRHILEDGFNFAIHVWKELDGTKKKPIVKWWIVDGHGRREVVRYLVEEEGYTVDALPCVEIEAVSLADAKRKVLNASSAFNTMTKDGLYEFMTDIGLGIEKLEEFVLPEIDLPEFKMEHFGSPEEKGKDGEKEEVTFDAYNSASVKQVVLYFPKEEYEQLIKGLDALAEKMQVEDYSQVVWRLVSEANRA